KPRHQIGEAARCETHDEPHGLGRILLRVLRVCETNSKRQNNSGGDTDGTHPDWSPLETFWIRKSDILHSPSRSGEPAMSSYKVVRGARVLNARTQEPAGADDST